MVGRTGTGGAVIGELPPRRVSYRGGRESGAGAIHPGYGFLAERASFAAAVEKAGLVFIGPSPESIQAMGDKTEARRRMAEAGVPIIPGALEPTSGPEEAADTARELGFPVLLKAIDQRSLAEKSKDWHGAVLAGSVPE